METGAAVNADRAPAVARASDPKLDSARYVQMTTACLTHRLSLAAIGLLVLNDQLLKALYPSWLTGKLSDFAGLYFFPYLCLLVVFVEVWLAQWVARGERRLPATAANVLAAAVFLTTATLFAALKVSSVTAEPVLRLVERVTGWAPVIVCDPTDLLALVVLLPAYWYWRRCRAQALS
jgi:hypothetical protein